MTDALPLPAHAPVVLVVLDGWGLEAPSPGNAIDLADTPVFDRLWATRPHTTLKTCGHDVGLPAGQMGNSEVGHLNLGAGFIVYQSITRIDLAIEDGSFFANPALHAAYGAVKAPGRTLHLLGLVSDGGVHSHIRHLDALLELAQREGVNAVAIHAILDGRDTSPTGGAEYLHDVEAMCLRHGRGRIASVVGRYYAMDRDKRWERIRNAYDLFVSGKGKPTEDVVSAVEQQYEAGITDEFMVPLSVQRNGKSPLTLRDGDSVIFFNFRADRAREMTQALIGPAVEGQAFDDCPQDLNFVMMTDYADYFTACTAFPAIDVHVPLARVISECGYAQFHTAETEKYAHVTYFFNGGREEPFAGEQRAMVQSPKVATYDLQPQMSAVGVGADTVAAIRSGEHAFVLVNFANCDMVGHTGVINAAIKATETVDTQLGLIVAAAGEVGGTVLVTADHGNAEQMLVPGTNQPMTAHTTNPVPFIVVAPESVLPADARLRDGGRLADVAPTVLDLLGIAPPSEMTGNSLLRLES